MNQIILVNSNDYYYYSTSSSVYLSIYNSHKFRLFLLYLTAMADKLAQMNKMIEEVVEVLGNLSTSILLSIDLLASLNRFSFLMFVFCFVCILAICISQATIRC